MNFRALCIWIAPTLLAFPLLFGCTKHQKSEGPNGHALFANSCARCHGAAGGGGSASYEGGPAPRNFRDHAFQIARTDTELTDAIVKGRGTAMPAFGTMFNELELAALVRQIRHFDQEGQP